LIITRPRPLVWQAPRGGGTPSAGGGGLPPAEGILRQVVARHRIGAGAGAAAVVLVGAAAAAPFELGRVPQGLEDGALPVDLLEGVLPHVPRFRRKEAAGVDLPPVGDEDVPLARMDAGPEGLRILAPALGQDPAELGPFGGLHPEGGLLRELGQPVEEGLVLLGAEGLQLPPPA